MVTLEEYLGGIFASLSQARMMADAQAVSVAETYARHELLRHFTVPHLRFNAVELTIPIAIEAVQPAPSGGIAAPEREAMRNGILGGLTRPLGVRSFSPAAAAALNALIDEGIERLARRVDGDRTDERVAEFAEELARDVGAALDKIGLDPGRFNSGKAAAAIRAVANVHARPAAPSADPRGLQVVAETHRLREMRPSDVITIKMSVTEEGMEWQMSETSDGRTERKLLPE